MQAATAPPAEGQNRGDGLLSAVAAVVLTISVAVCDAVPLMVTDAGCRLHAGGSLAAAGVIAQLRLTAPVNPNSGVRVMAAELPDVAPGETVIDVPAIEKFGGAVVVKDSMTPTVVPALLSATAWK
jgi:hypothetical protein